MNFSKWISLLLVMLSIDLSSALAAASNASDPQGVIFSAEQLKDQEFFIHIPGPYWTPSKEQVDNLEKNLSAYLKERSKTMDLSKFKRQYFGYSLNGKQVIYVNAGCRNFGDYKTTIVFIEDGGPCFFRATFDPETDKFVSFSVNGHA